MHLRDSSSWSSVFYNQSGLKISKTDIVSTGWRKSRLVHIFASTLEYFVQAFTSEGNSPFNKLSSRSQEKEKEKKAKSKSKPSKEDAERSRQKRRRQERMGVQEDLEGCPNCYKCLLVLFNIILGVRKLHTFWFLCKFIVFFNIFLKRSTGVRTLTVPRIIRAFFYLYTDARSKMWSWRNHWCVPKHFTVEFSGP